MGKNRVNIRPKSDPYGKGCLSSLKIEACQRVVEPREDNEKGMFKSGIADRGLRI